MTDRDYPKIVVPPPGPKARAIVERDAAWTSHCYIKEYPLAIARGEGVMVEDIDGNRYLDFMAGIAVASTGYGHPHVVKAIQDAAANFLHICGSDFYYEGMATLCERLAKVAPGPTKKRVFLTNSGTEAVEGAIKLARYATRRTAMIAFKGAFHGRSTGAVSLTSSKARQHAGFGPLLPDVHHVDYAYRYRCRHCADRPACSLGCVTSIEDDLFARHLDPHDVAAIFVEPIQGEGGVRVIDPHFLRGLRALTRERNVLLILDEIQCGLGRTGSFFAYEQLGLEPDILTLAKPLAGGLPMGAILVTDAVAKAIQAGDHGTTFGGGPLLSHVAHHVVQRLADPAMLKHVRETGAWFGTQLHAIAERTGRVREIRGTGLMWGMDVHESASGVIARAFDHGLLLVSAGEHTLRFLPPLVISRDELSAGLEILEHAIMG